MLKTKRGTVRALVAGERGPAVVLGPGLVGSAEDYAPVLPAIAAAGFRALAYDFQGHYEAGDDGPHTVERHAGDLLAVIEAFAGDEPAHVVGHSLGGFVARAAGLREPARFRSLTMIASGPQMTSDRLRQTLDRFEQALVAQGPELMWPLILRILPGSDGGRRDLWRRRLDTMRLPFLRGMLQSLAGEDDLGRELRLTPYGKMVLHGARDRRLWPHAEMAAYAGTAGATHVIVPETGHSPMLERAAETAEQLVAFWTAADRERATRLCLEIVRPRPAGDPYPAYARLRATAPVMLLDRPGLGSAVFLTRYADCHRLLNDRTCHAVGETPEHLPAGWDDGPFRAKMLRSFGLREGQAHLPVRAALARNLNPRRTESYLRDASSITDQLLDRFAARLADGVVNATEALAVPFASLTTGRMLGLPDDEALRLGDLVGATSTVLEPSSTPRQRAGVEEAGAGVLAGLRGRRGGLAGLVHDQHPSDEEGALGDLVMLFGAAHDSPASLVAVALKLLLENPGQAALVRDDPGRADACITEVLRLEPPVQIAVRVTTEPCRYGDVEVPAGTKMHAVLGAANRDPAYTDDPDSFRITRTVRGPSLSFGAGRHYCPGAAVARMQAAVLITRVLQRFPGLRLAGPPRFRAPGTLLRRIDDLPVTLEPACVSC
ncbi:cytochrome P450 [Actinoplanes bogorensis]|uniref:Cytochrome P450 n=1 Tax=Paractinoplanes bogorensis TaxID=1610840 RepID=A0ABS5Z7Y9_9ACTN|nr:cytochrome P450 [Actinoplanes bogorensis]MBU2671043.1 cytochrome P450 [Actinoplanes bogorensis]